MDSLRHLEAAEGYLQLGMWVDAGDELAALEPETRAEPRARLLRLHVLHGLQQWETAARLAEAMLDEGLRHSAVYINGAYAIRRSRSLKEAMAFLRRGEADLADDAIFHFNLACYHCQLGEIETAKPHLACAIQLRPEMREQVAAEPDLEPLRDWC